MTEKEAREILLRFPDAFESSHHGHPDFRCKKGIFATFQPEKGIAVLRLPPEFSGVAPGESNSGRRVVSTIGGKAWVAFELDSVEKEDFEFLAGIAFESRK